MELIQRVGAQGFGAGNITALWRAVQAYLTQNTKPSSWCYPDINNHLFMWCEIWSKNKCFCCLSLMLPIRYVFIFFLLLDRDLLYCVFNNIHWILVPFLWDYFLVIWSTQSNFHWSGIFNIRIVIFSSIFSLQYITFFRRIVIF